MRLRYDFDIVDMDGDLIAYPVPRDGEIFKGILRLNEPTAYIIELLKEDTDIGKIHLALKARYPDSTDQEIGEELAPFMTALSQQGLIEMP